MPFAAQDEEGSFYFYLESNNEEILRGIQLFPTERDALRAARDVLFLAGLPDSYSRINDREEKQYSFDVVYTDSGYTEMITALYETDEAYNKRKEKFLDHLLARFSEDFTDYVLMMYALNGKKNDPALNIRDKSNFLSVVPGHQRLPLQGIQLPGNTKRIARKRPAGTRFKADRDRA